LALETSSAVLEASNFRSSFRRDHLMVARLR